MNTLSWLIYAAEFFSRLTPVLIVFGCGGFLAGVPLAISGSVPWTRYSYQSDAEWGTTMELRSSLKLLGRALLIASPICILVGTALPSSRTVYLIAASEVGETVVTHPDTVEMMGNLRDIIKKRLREELGDE